MSSNACSVRMGNTKPMAATTAAPIVWIIPTTLSSRPQASMLVSVIMASIKAWTASRAMRAKLASLITKQARASALIASQIGGGLKSEEEFREFWVISSWIYVSITVIALIFATIDIIKQKRYKKINYDILFYFSFFIVIALLIFNALYIQDAYLFHIALEINLAFAFVSFYTLVMPSKE